jgi:hypothetical protein
MQQVDNYGRACTHVLFLHKSRAGIFSEAGWYLTLVRRSRYNFGWYLSLQKIPLAENTFLQAGQRELTIQKNNPGSALRMSQRLSHM